MKAAAAALCAAALLAGCAAVEGRAEPENATATEPSFNPCDDIPDDAIRAIGMDPATESRDIFGVHQPGWNICGWNNSTHFIAVFTTNYTIGDIRRNSAYEGLSDGAVGGRAVVQYHDSTDRAGTTCDLATVSGSGTVIFSVSESGEEPPAHGPCTAVRAMATALMPFVPE